MSVGALVPNRPLVGNAARRALFAGAQRMVRIVSPTLGPLGRTVLVGRILDGQPPEAVDQASTTARRIYELGPFGQNAGAMLVRHLLCTVQDRAGDGSATAAVITGALLAEAERALAAGEPPQRFVASLEEGLRRVLPMLRSLAAPVGVPEQLTAMAIEAVGSTPLGTMIGEAVASVGPDGVVLVERSPITATTVDYADGSEWSSDWITARFAASADATIKLKAPAILVAASPIRSSRPLLPVLEACLRQGSRELLVVTPSMSSEAIAFLLANRREQVLSQVAAVAAPGAGEVQEEALLDIAAITGARCVRLDDDDELGGFRPSDLGGSTLAWAQQRRFAIVGVRGGRAEIRARREEAKRILSRPSLEPWVRTRTRERLSKLAGCSAIVLVGGATTVEQEEVKRRVESALASTAAARRSGVVPGGGGALAACSGRLRTEMDQGRTCGGAGLRALVDALTRPMSVLLENAGREPGPIVHEAQAHGAAATFDVRTGAWVGREATGLLDAVDILEYVLVASVSVAASVIGADAVTPAVGRGDPLSP
ncbi:MAG: TCP-1/cpn60 chaperonin family protein [Candidatus Dormiibacterota bacterium]